MVCLLLANLEGALLEGGFEVTGLAAEYDLMDLELMWSTDDLAVRKLLGILLVQARTVVGCFRSICVHRDTSVVRRDTSAMFAQYPTPARQLFKARNSSLPVCIHCIVMIIAGRANSGAHHRISSPQLEQ